MISVRTHTPTIGENILADPGYEVDKPNTTAWFNSGGTLTVATDATDKHSGIRCVKVTTTTAAANNNMVLRNQKVHYNAKLRAGVWAKAANGVKIRVRWGIAYGNYTATWWSNWLDVVMTGAWQYVYLDATNVMTRSIQFAVLINEPTIGVTLWLDDGELKITG